MTRLLRLLTELAALLGIYLVLETMDDVLAEVSISLLRLIER